MKFTKSSNGVKYLRSQNYEPNTTMTKGFDIANTENSEKALLRVENHVYLKLISQRFVFPKGESSNSRVHGKTAGLSPSCEYFYPLNYVLWRTLIMREEGYATDSDGQALNKNSLYSSKW